MSTTALLHANAPQIMPLLRTLATYSALGALLITFRPLLVGLIRATWLLMFPRMSRDDRLGRDLMRDQRVIARLIQSSTGPSMSAELRAMAARD